MFLYRSNKEVTYFLFWDFNRNIVFDAGKCIELMGTGAGSLLIVLLFPVGKRLLIRRKTILFAKIWRIIGKEVPLAAQSVIFSD